MSCFTTGGPGKEQGTNKPPLIWRVRERSKGYTTCPATSQNPSRWHSSWLNKACTTRKDSESKRLAKDNLEINPITIKPWDCEPRGRAVLGSLTLLLSSRVPFPNKISCFVSTCVSSDNSFPSVRQQLSFGPWKGSLFLQQSHFPPGVSTMCHMVCLFLVSLPEPPAGAESFSMPWCIPPSENGAWPRVHVCWVRGAWNLFEQLIESWDCQSWGSGRLIGKGWAWRKKAAN